MFGSHQLRPSTASVRLVIAKKPIASDPDNRCKAEESKSLKIKKIVRFSPTVEIYEYNPDDDDGDSECQFLEAGDKEMSEITKMEAKKLSRMRANCRYSGIREGNEEEAETHDTDLGVYACGVSETALLMQSAEDSIQNPAPFHLSPIQDLKAVKFNRKRLNRSRAVMTPIENQSQWKALLMQSAVENPTPFHPSPCQELKDVNFNQKRLNRSHYCANSVMKPIENMSKWKAIKAREAAQFPLQTEKDSTASASRMRSWPSNCRYKDCRDNYGEEDEIQRKCESKSTKATSSSPNAEGSLMRLPHLPNKEPKAEKLNPNVRCRRKYLTSVLNPIDNLSQWKAAIAKSRFMHPGKENMAIH